MCLSVSFGPYIYKDYIFFDGWLTRKAATAIPEPIAIADAMMMLLDVSGFSWRLDV